MSFDDEDVFNAELKYIADDIRGLVKVAREAMGVLRMCKSPENALRFQVSLEELLMGLIATGRYSKKSVGKKGEKEKISPLDEDIENLAKTDHKKEKTYPNLFNVHVSVLWKISTENLFQKKKRKVDKA